ncbi:PKD domain-containing protein [Maribellus sediminis]|uniref:PKD domain-containing protein n=1 Tax=Maribellus sediminis TaxID=2696285 RepID=UPI0014312FDC|nr:PKD domain-containing protein [Maribellus sediminis]
MKNKFKILLLLSAVALFFTACDNGDDTTEVTACFTYSPETTLQVGDTLYFSNCSENAIDYTWDFGDETTSTEAGPYHIYDAPGTYDVTLTAVNGGISNILTKQISIDADLAFIVNYGSYNSASSTISAFDKYADEVTNNYYEYVNNTTLNSNIQYAYTYADKIYMLGNVADQLFWVDSKTLEQSANGIQDVDKPRYCIADGNYLYVSCWGSDDIFYGDLTQSYIAKVNLETNSVEKEITLHGGPEGLAIVNNKLYAALNYMDSIAVMDLATEEISYIETSAFPSYFEKDAQGNLYVALTRAWDDYVTQTGIGYLNTTSDEIEAFYALDGVGTTYDNSLTFNADQSKLYVMSSGYDANWNLSGAVSAFDVASKSFDSGNVIEGISGINGIQYFNNKLFCFIAETVTSSGKVVSYSTDGTKIKEYQTGAAPFMLLTSE